MIRNFPVTVHDADDKTHNVTTKQVYLKPHWSVNAAGRPLATLETKLMSALAQGLANKVLQRQG